MKITIYRVDVTLFRGETIFARWSEWSFEASVYSVRDPVEGFRTERWESKSIEVDVPVGSVLAGQPKRLKTYFSHPPGLDATNVWFFGSKNERGFSLVEPEPEPGARKTPGRILRAGDPR